MDEDVVDVVTKIGGGVRVGVDGACNQFFSVNKVERGDGVGEGGM